MNKALHPAIKSVSFTPYTWQTVENAHGAWEIFHMRDEVVTETRPTKSEAVARCAQLNREC